MRDRRRGRKGRRHGPTWHTSLAFLAVGDIVHRQKEGQGEGGGRDSGRAAAPDVRGQHWRFKTGGRASKVKKIGILKLFFVDKS